MLDYFGKSITGRRPYNQDAFLTEHFSSDLQVFAIADGMGGAAGGEIASAIAIEVLKNKIRLSMEALHEGRAIIPDLFKQIISDIHQSINEKVALSPELSGMGTTLCALLVRNGELSWLNIGDSRIYIQSNSQLELVTEDDTYIEDLIRSGKDKDYSSETLKNYQHVLTKALDGSNSEATFYLFTDHQLQLNQCEFILLCSDGLITEKSAQSITAKTLENQLSVRESAKYMCEKLIDQAFRNGSLDNISTIVVVPNSIDTETALQRKHKPQKVNATTILIGSTIVILIILALIAANKV